MAFTNLKKKDMFDGLLDVDAAQTTGVFGDAPKKQFIGKQADLQFYLKENFADLYNNLFIYRVDNKERDWFFAFAREVVQEMLLKHGFTWVRPVHALFTNKDGTTTEKIEWWGGELVNGFFKKVELSEGELARLYGSAAVS